MLDLHTSSGEFAQELQSTLAGVLPGEFQIVSIAHHDRFVVRPDGKTSAEQRVPLYVGGEHLADLGVQIYLGSDSSGRFLKAWQSRLAVHSVLDRTPLFRQEFDAAMSLSAPMAHWHVHADRGALSHLLGRSHAIRSEAVKKPHDMSSLHIPVGGERFRPCVEDFLEFLVREFGIDHEEDWQSAVLEGRERWRRLQFRSTVRDLQNEAAEVLAAHGWELVPPGTPPTTGPGVLSRW